MKMDEYCPIDNDRELAHLPCHKFPSKFRYFLSESCSSITVIIFLIIDLIFASATVIELLLTHDDSAAGGFGIGLFASSLTTVIISCIFFFQRTETITGTQAKMKFFLEIIQYKPNATSKSWDVIAAHMNTYFYREGHWANENFFYSGKECYNWFMELTTKVEYVPIEQPPRASQEDSSEPIENSKKPTPTSTTSIPIAQPIPHVADANPNANPVVINKWAQNKTPTNIISSKKNQRPKANMPLTERIVTTIDDLELKRYETVAVDVYRDAVRDYWCDAYPDAAVLLSKLNKDDQADPFNEIK